MTNSTNIRLDLACIALGHVPPMISDDLIAQREFRNEYGITVDAHITLGDTSFECAVLFSAIREVLSVRYSLVIADIQGREWTVSVENTKGKERLVPVIFSDSQRYLLSGFTALSENRSVRLCSFAENAFDVNLPKSAVDTWHGILSARALLDDEIGQLLDDFRDTPVASERLIHTTMKTGKSSIFSLIPSSRKYYERLVGEYNGEGSIKDYAASPGKRLMESISEWHSYKGFMFSLLLSSHSVLTSKICTDGLKGQELARAYKFLVDRGDRLSQLGAIEVGLRILPDSPEIEPILIQLIRGILDDNTDNAASGFNLLSALFVLVDSQISKCRILSDTPPFYRRLASLAQATLIHRQITQMGLSATGIDSLCEWAKGNGTEQFYCQSLVDIRLEPHWDPTFSDASQLKSEFLGRLMNAGKTYTDNISSGELRDILFGSSAGSIGSLVDSLRPYFPGPLEGSGIDLNELPSDYSDIIKTHLNTDNMDADSFAPLVNFALTHRIDSDWAELAIEALKRGQHRLANIESEAHLISVLNGLASVAAVSRQASLADEIRILVRRYRRDAQYPLSAPNAFYICLVAAASRSDTRDWCDFVGNWMTEMAFWDFEEDEGNFLLVSLGHLCHIVPELWVSCGRAYAALTAYLAVK